jgi:hypothetical protein
MTSKTAVPKSIKSAPKSKPSGAKTRAKAKSALKTGGRFLRSAKTHTCSRCTVRQPSSHFPTVTGTDQRLGECRGCRDDRTPSGIKGKTTAAAA